MPELTFKRKEIPFLLGGAGELSVNTGNLAPNQKLSEADTTILNASFKAGGDQKVTLGQEQSVKLGVSATSSVRVAAAFASSTGEPKKLLAAHGLGDFFKGGANKDKVVLGFDVAGSAAVAAAGSFSYTALKATVEVDAGADGSYTYLKALDRNLPLTQLLPAFFKTMRLPEQGATAPEPGEAIALRYGGYLRLAADVSAGYKLAGTKSFALGDLALSEKYDLSILGKVGLSAGVAGRFSILVTAGDQPGWARVVVRRHKSKDLKIAADVNVGLKHELQGLPGSAEEFLGAALGVNAKNFLNLLQRAQGSGKFTDFSASIDGLAKSFISEYVGKAFDKLESETEFGKFLERVNQTVTSYEKLGDRAVTLFDRYFDRLQVLTDFLDKIEEMTSLEPLRGKLDGDAWNILSMLTGGDPLGFLLGQAEGKRVEVLAELKKRAGAALELIRGQAHGEIRRVVELAKSQFGIDGFFRELAKVDTVAELEAIAKQKAGQFVSRLVGRGLDSSTNVKKAFEEVRAVLGRMGEFRKTLNKKFEEAASASYKAALHTEFSRSSESDALIDVLLNLAGERGAQLLKQAGRGDFEEILSLADPSLVRLSEGVLTHKTVRQSAFRVNIVGWHLNYNYQGFDKVITETEQRLAPSADGITIYTTASLQVERMRKRNDEEMHVNFLLRAIGESAGIVRSDERNLAYLIDTLTSLNARYELSFTDLDTSEGELRDYLAFAKDVGLDRKGATFAELSPVLERSANGGFGPVSASYDVRFGSSAIQSLITVRELKPEAESSIRSAMRRMVLANYLKAEGVHDIAFAYATPAIYARFRRLGPAAFVPPSAREEAIAIEFPGVAAPERVVMERHEYQVLTTLYNIEDSLVEAVKQLCRLLDEGKPLKPGDFSKKLEKFGKALVEFDRFDQASTRDGTGASTIFAMFDTLVRLAGGGAGGTAASLTLKSKANGKDVEKVFLSDGALVA